MIPNLFLLTGPDDFRLHQRFQFYKSGFFTKYPEGEYSVLKNETPFADLESIALTPSLFGEKRFVLLDSFWTPEKFEQAEKSGFFDHLTQMADSVTIFCIEPQLDKRKKFSKYLLANTKTEIFETLDEGNLVQWVLEYTKSQGGDLKFQEGSLLVRRCGDNGWNLAREIEKLITAADGETISAQLIEDLTIPHPKMVIWDFTDCLSRKNIPGAMKALSILLDSGESLHQIFAMIVREVRIHAQLRSALDHNVPESAIAKRTKLHPFVVKKTLSRSRNFSMNQIRGMYEGLFKIDQMMKTGRITLTSDDNSEFALAIEKWIVENCR